MSDSPGWGGRAAAIGERIMDYKGKGHESKRLGSAFYQNPKRYGHCQAAPHGQFPRVCHAMLLSRSMPGYAKHSPWALSKSPLSIETSVSELVRRNSEAYCAACLILFIVALPQIRIDGLQGG